MSRTLSALTRLSSLRPIASTSARSFSSSNSLLSKTYCIRNIPFTLSETDLSNFLFDKIGVRAEVNIPGGERMKRGVKMKWSKGFGFLRVPDSYDQKVMDLSGEEIDGRPCNIDHYVVKQSEANWADDMENWANSGEKEGPGSGNKGPPF